MAILQTISAWSIGAFWTATFVVPRLLWIVITRPRSFFNSKNRDRRTDVLCDTELGEHDYIKVNNVKYHYVTKGEHSKPLMLMLHGFPECWYSWRHQIKEFSDEYRVVAVDTRGYGESDKPMGIANYQLKYLVDDVNELVLALGYTKCVLVGHDWGAAVSWCVASRYPNIVDKLIVMNVPHGRAFGKHISKSRSQFLKSWYMFFFQLPWLPEIFLSNNDYEFVDGCFRGKRMGLQCCKMADDEIEAFKYTLSQKGCLTSAINYYRAAFRYPADPNVYSRKITEVPVLLVWGDKDAALEKEMATLSGNYVTDFTLEMIAGASHWVQQDNPQLVNAKMWSFLKK